MKKQLIVDWIPFIVPKDQLNESLTKNNGKLVVTGVLQIADSKNQNGRIYPKRLLEREATKYMEIVKDRRAHGELDHPDRSIIELKNVSHIISNMWWDGDNLMGECEILTTPMGNILRELILNEVRVGVSSRGLGSTKQRFDGAAEVQEDFELVCWDFVSNPSVHTAWMSPVTESVDPSKTSLEHVQTFDRVQNLVYDILSELV